MLRSSNMPCQRTLPLSQLLRTSYLLIATWAVCTFTYCQHSNEAPAELVGPPCEGCEAVLEYEKSKLSSADTLPDFDKDGQNMLLTGTVYETDGKTPAKGVIMYVYHTNQEGIYPARGDEHGWGRHHGYIRGWVSTDADGQYAVFTQKPAPYPSRSEPAHVHAIVLEPSGRYYWIQSFLFDGDPLLSSDITRQSGPRGGNGIVQLDTISDLLVGRRDIYLGRNIPDY